MRPTSATPFLWALVVLLLAGTVAASLIISSITGRDPPLGTLALGGALISVVVLALWLERPQPTAGPRERMLPEAALQELGGILRDSPFVNLATHQELLYGTPDAFQGVISHSDMPMVNLSSILHTAAQHDPPVLQQILTNACAFMGDDHPRTRDIGRWRKTWGV